MNKILHIILISLFSFTIITCAKKSSTSSSSTTDNTTTTTDTTAPVISGSTIPTPTNDNTPDFIITSSEAGTITYYGSCSSSTTSAIAGTITVTLIALSEGTYADCVFRVTDSAGNGSAFFTMRPFIIDTTAPVIAEETAVTTPTREFYTKLHFYI